ncbi:toluene tolerance protein [Thiohalobacter sp. COW1]|uniref:ABC-type transporter, auxiliary component n=1 Tax=Thiohalobacter thiocyanaticus TaxID=585455 RepID=A0A1Z4VUY8_9GAMM|nr:MULTISPECIES: ABC transporter substrate-binding protein [Thiohalobacter]BAZ95323.1 ABC-type transporter, auxiliary component [Thiohalobacter thiocyanaticus]BCO32725.1 toluene tolerance protein [Thiohalobacter sp. COW1]
MKTTLTLQLILLPVLWLLLASAKAGESPMKVVRETSEQVFAELRQNGELSPEQLNGLIERVILPHVDFEAFSRLTLARYWREASEAQRRDFTREFRSLLVRTYATSLSEYSGEEVEYLRERMEDDDRALVNTRIVRPDGPPIPVDYRLRLNGEKWQVYDIMIDGISLIINYRSSFQQTIRQQGLDALIRQLAERRA